MKKPDPKLIFSGCSDVVQDYIKHLECEVIHLNAIRGLFVIQEGCSPVDRVVELINENMLLKSANHNVTDQDYAERCSAEQAIKQREQLDQFAMAVIRSCLQGAANQCANGVIKPEQVITDAVVSAYDIAEAMQAESQKRQGGAV